MESAGCSFTRQTGSSGEFLSAGSRRGVRVDGVKRELEEEEAVGERWACRFLLLMPWGCQGKFELLPGVTDCCLSLPGSLLSTVLWE